MYYTTASTFSPSPLKGVDIPIHSQVSPLPTNPSGVRMGKNHKKKKLCLKFSRNTVFQKFIKIGGPVKVTSVNPIYNSMVNCYSYQTALGFCIWGNSYKNDTFVTLFLFVNPFRTTKVPCTITWTEWSQKEEKTTRIQYRSSCQTPKFWIYVMPVFVTPNLKKFNIEQNFMSSRKKWIELW